MVEQDPQQIAFPKLDDEQVAALAEFATGTPSFGSTTASAFPPAAF